MSTSNRKNEHEIVIEAITDALFELIDKKPIDEISVSELIIRAGISRGTYYNNFDSKEDIINTFLDGVLEEFGADFEVNSIDDLYSHKHQRDVFHRVVKYTKAVLVLKKSGLDKLFLPRLTNYILNLGFNKCLDDELRLIGLAGMEYNLIFNWYALDPEKCAAQLSYALDNDARFND